MQPKLPGWRELPLAAIISTPGNTVENKMHAWRTFKPVLDRDKCIRCRTCWSYCPEAAIIEVDCIYDTPSGKIKGVCFEIDYDHCKGCGICANECPVGAIKLIPEER